MDKFKHQCACGIEFKQKKNLYAHMRKQHNVEPLQSKPEKIYNYECDLCGRKFSCQSSIIRHLRRNHSDCNNKLIGVNKKISLICPYGKCSEHFRTYEVLREHLVKRHDFQVEFEELTFSSLEDFNQWKDSMEVQTLSLYTQSTAARTLRIELGHRLYFNCHRSNVYKHRGNNIRAIKAQGSNKIGKACPSRLEVTYTSYAGQIIIKVKFWKTHCGHTHQVKTLPLNRQIKCLIAEKLKEGFNFEQIVDWIHVSSELSVDSVTSKKLQLISRKEIYNIIRDFKIKPAKKRTAERSKNIDIDKSNITGKNDSESNITRAVDMKNNLLLTSISGNNKVSNITGKNYSENNITLTVDMKNNLLLTGGNNKVFQINDSKALPTASGSNSSNFELSGSETHVPTIIDTSIRINEELVHKAELFLNLAKVVSLNDQVSVYIEEQVDKLIKIAKPGILDTKITIPDGKINKESNYLDESLINKTELLLNLVKTVPLGDEDSRDIAEQINALIEKAKLSNLDDKQLLQQEIQNKVFENNETKYTECDVNIKIENISSFNENEM